MSAELETVLAYHSLMARLRLATLGVRLTCSADSGGQCSYSSPALVAPLGPGPVVSTTWWDFTVRCPQRAIPMSLGALRKNDYVGHKMGKLVSNSQFWYREYDYGLKLCGPPF